MVVMVFCFYFCFVMASRKVTIPTSFLQRPPLLGGRKLKRSALPCQQGLKKTQLLSRKADMPTLYRGYEKSQSVPTAPCQCEPDQVRAQSLQQADSTEPRPRASLCFSFLHSFASYSHLPQQKQSIFWAEWSERFSMSLPAKTSVQLWRGRDAR